MHSNEHVEGSEKNAEYNDRGALSSSFAIKDPANSHRVAHLQLACGFWRTARYQSWITVSMAPPR